MDGAWFIYGHVMMQRALGMGYQSAWAKANLPGRRERNAFYTRSASLWHQAGQAWLSWS